MSKTGNKKITIKKDIFLQIDLNLQIVKIKNISEILKEILFKNILIIYENEEILIFCLNENSSFIKFFGLFHSLLYNMIEGITNNWSKLLIIEGIGYKFALDNSFLQIFAGFSHKIIFSIPKDIKISLLTQSRIVISGIDKVNVGLFAAKIKNVKKPDPYGGKGIRYNNDVIIKKIGKKERKSKKLKK